MHENRGGEVLTQRLLLEEQEDGVQKLKVLGEVVELWAETRLVGRNLTRFR